MATPISQLPSSQPVASPSTASANSTTTEYTVRIPNDKKKKFSMIKFATGTEVDFLKLSQTSVKMERENNLKEYKSIYDVDTMPKFGAGSEFGREQKEEARRKKYGIHIKSYNPEDQPWIMKIGSGKQARRFKGVREGTITENTSYYIFTKCADGAFEAIPIEEWYNFQPMIRYKYLNADEAEDEFKRRDRTMNLFSVMVRKRVKNEKDVEDPDDEEKKTKSKKKVKKTSSLQLTDMDDWVISSDEDEDDADDEDGEDSKPKKEKKKTKKGKKAVKKRNAKHNSDDEAIEESDEGDFDDREVDYITDSGDSDSDIEDKDEKEDKYDDKGVDQETGLKKLIDSDESSEEEEEKKNEDETNEEPAEKQKDKKDGEESDSSSSSSGSESDIEKETFSSAVFMQKKGSKGSRSNTPTSVDGRDKSGLKRKLEEEESTAKKMRTDSPQLSAGSSGEITVEAIRRYLLRKPMTAKELVQKFKSKKPQMTKEQMIHKIVQLLKIINPDKKYVNNKLYLSVKKDT